MVKTKEKCNRLLVIAGRDCGAFEGLRAANVLRVRNVNIEQPPWNELDSSYLLLRIEHSKVLLSILLSTS